MGGQDPGANQRLWTPSVFFSFPADVELPPVNKHGARCLSQQTPYGPSRILSCPLASGLFLDGIFP